MKEKFNMQTVFLVLLLTGLLLFQFEARIDATFSSGKQGIEKSLSQEVADKLLEWVPEQMKKQNIPGASIAVIDNQKILWEKMYGCIDGPGSPSVDEETLFCVRSISKNFTALAVLMAVQDGLLDLDTPINKYLPGTSARTPDLASTRTPGLASTRTPGLASTRTPGFTVNSRYGPEPEKRITIRHMLAHRAGFTHDPPLGNHFNDTGYFSRYIKSISNSWLLSPVGYRFSYSNYGYDLAAHILQLRSGKPFAQYVKEKILDPLGMTQSSFDLEWSLQRKNRARGHNVDGKGNIPLRFPEIASAGLYSNIRDMAKYVRFHLNGGFVKGCRILRPDLMKTFHSLLFQLPGQRSGYGCGLIREVTANTFSLYHAGGGRGFQTLMMFYPELKYGVVILTNSYEHNLTGIQAREIINAPVFKRYGRNIAAEPGTENMKQLKPNAARIKAVMGRYGDRYGFKLAFKDGIPGIYPADKTFYPLTFYLHNGQLVGMYGKFREVRFLPAYENRGAVPIEKKRGAAPINRGSLMQVHRKFSNSNLHYLPFNDSPEDQPGPNKSQWKKYLGEYQLLWQDEPTETVRITIKNGYLYFGESKCIEHEEGLFFLYNGRVLDFRNNPPMMDTNKLKKKKSQETPRL